MSNSSPTSNSRSAAIPLRVGALAPGMDGLEPPRKLEAMPYVVTKSASEITNNAYGQKANVTVGGDITHCPRSTRQGTGR